MIFCHPTRSLDAAVLVLLVALFSNVSEGAEPASDDRPVPEKSAGKPARKNAKLPGLVINEFTPEKEMNPDRPAFTRITFKDKGLTSNALRIWSGDTLMNLDRYQAPKMAIKKIGDDDDLFMEAGGFSTRNPAGWKSPFYVMKRQ